MDPAGSAFSIVYMHVDEQPMDLVAGGDGSRPNMPNLKFCDPHTLALACSARSIIEDSSRKVLLSSKFALVQARSFCIVAIGHRLINDSLPSGIAFVG